VVYTCDLEGSLPLADSTFTATADLTASEQHLALEWAPAGGGELHFEDLCSVFGADSPTLDTAIGDLHLTDARATLDLTSQDDRFVVLGTSAYPGAAFVVVDRVADAEPPRWILGFGIAVEPDMSKLPLVGSAFDKLFTVSAAELLVATDTIASFTWPDEDADRKSVFSAFPFSLDRGAAAVLIGDVTSPGAPAAVSKLYAAKGTGSTDILLKAQLQNPVILTADFGGFSIYKMPFSNLSLTVETGTAVPFLFSIAATMQLSAWKDGLTATGSLVVSDEDMQGELALLLTEPLTLPDVPGVAIDEVAGTLGIDFVKPELFAGFLGKFKLGKLPRKNNVPLDAAQRALQTMLPSGGGSHVAPAPSQDELCLVLGVNVAAGGIPVPDVDVLLLKLQKLSVSDVYGAIIGDPPALLKATLGSVVLEDVQLYWSDDSPATQLPDGTSAKPGFHFHGELLLWNALTAWAELEVKADRFAGNAYISSINIPNVLSITGDTVPEDDAARLPVDFKAGGPWLAVDTTGNPDYLAGSWNVTLFHYPSNALDVEVSESLFTFYVAYQVGSVFDDQLTCRLTADWTHLEIDASGKLERSVTIPPFLGVNGLTLDLDTSYSGTVVVDFNGTDVTFSLKNAQFEFGGQQLTIPAVTLDAPIGRLEDIADAVLNSIHKTASDVFHDLLSTAEHEFVTLGDDITAIEKDLAHLGQDFVNAVTSLFHKHSSNKPSWLKNNNLVSDDGSTYYLLDGYVRRPMPDPNDVPADNGLTYDSLLDRDHYTHTPNVDPFALASLPIDKDPSGTIFQVPARVDGTVILDEHGKIYLIASSVDGQGNSVLGKYQVQNATNFLAILADNRRAAGVAQTGPQQLSRAADLHRIPDNGWLDKQPVMVQCAAGNSLMNEVSAFVDGVRYKAPAGISVFMIGSLGKAPQKIAASAYLGIPAGDPLVAISQGTVVNCGGMTYQADKNKLHRVSLETTSGPDTGTPISAVELSMLDIGKS